MATQLVHKLSSLGYTEGFDTSSLPLVERLVADLCAAADAYRALEARALEATEHKEQAGYQVRWKVKGVQGIWATSQWQKRSCFGLERCFTK